MADEFDSTHGGNVPWLATVRLAAEQFIESHYAHESPYFENWWRVLSTKIGEVVTSAPAGRLTIEGPGHLIENISLTGSASLGLVTPIVIGTITETLWGLKNYQPSNEELRQLVTSSAARLGASHQLNACLTRYVPDLIVSVLKHQHECGDAIIGKATPPQYAIYTMGEERIVETITAYERKRRRYLLWLDLNDTSHALANSPKTKLGQQAVRVLLCLVRNIGVVRPAKDLYRDVWDSTTDEIEASHIDAIEQQLTRLNRFTGGRFRRYLQRGDDNGYGLRDSFANQYFLFKRLR
jgi:hypothetical protein